MEHELHALRIQLAEKSMYSLQLRKEVILNPMVPSVVVGLKEYSNAGRTLAPEYDVNENNQIY